MVPLILGTLWTVAIMQSAGLKFNLVNVWALPLIIGSAAEYGMNIVLRALEAQTHGGGPPLARSTVMGVMLNGLTIMPDIPGDVLIRAIVAAARGPPLKCWSSRVKARPPSSTRSRRARAPSSRSRVNGGRS